MESRHYCQSLLRWTARQRPHLGLLPSRHPCLLRWADWILCARDRSASRLVWLAPEHLFRNPRHHHSNCNCRSCSEQLNMICALALQLYARVTVRSANALTFLTAVVPERRCIIVLSTILGWYLVDECYRLARSWGHCGIESARRVTE